MKKALLPAVLLLASLICRAENDGKITFAWLSDIHLNSFAYAREDLSDAIEDINGNPLIEFVIMSGDLTEFGDTREFMMLDTLLRELDRPYFMTTGNHDVNWSENGCTAFEKLLGPPHFCTEIKGYRFIGCGAGPALRMGPPQIPREELVWLDSVITATPEECPVIFINHFPIDESLCNAYEVSQILSKGNVKCVLSGHLHVNRAYDAGGIPGVIGRSTLRRADPAGGYNIVTIENGTMSFRERIIKRETKPLWHEVALNRAPESGKRGIQAPDYSINREFPRVREVWKIADVADIASRGAISGNTYIYTNTAGAVHAVNAKNGKHIWSFKSGNKIFSAPCISGDTVIITSCDGYIYALTLEEGSLIWKHDTEYPIVATPAVAGGVVYTGSGNGKFHAIDLKDGSPVWECSGLSGYIEAKPAIDSKNLYIGTWGAKFYAIERKSGKTVWEFDTGKGRYFSPGACWPQAVPYTADGKSRSQVVVLSSDNFLRAFDPDDGRILWASDQAAGRESLGISPDRKTVYIKGIGGTVTAADISAGRYSALWSLEMPYKSDFVPTNIECGARLLFIPTESGTIHAVGKDGGGVEWSRKVSHSAVTSLCNAGRNRLIANCMDGTVVCLEF